MANIFNNSRQQITEQQRLMNRYSVARGNLLVVVIFSLVNSILLLAGGGLYFLFSASMPYFLVDFAMYYGGRYPDEVYGSELGTIEFFDGTFFGVLLVISLLIIAVYFICWLFSKKNRVGWIIAALILFVLDTILMFSVYVFTVDMILDLVFHVWVVVSLAMGIHAHFKLKKLPEEAPMQYEAEPNNLPDSTPIRYADMEVKSRVLLDHEVFGHKIVYRRVKKTNELIIDDKVYAEYEALLERAHMLSANIDGHAIAVGFDGFSASYVMIDGQIVKQKTRLI